MLARFWLVLAALLLFTTAACPRPTPTAPEPRIEESAQLEFADGTATLYVEGEQLAMVDTPGALPYRIIQPASPSIVTTCGADLVPSTIVAGTEPVQFANMVPAAVEPPLIALISLAGAEDSPGGRVVLISPDGNICWEHPGAQLLLPSAGDVALSPVLAAPCSGSFLEPFGAEPVVYAIDPATGKQLWEARPPAPAPPDDIELVARTGGYGLLVLQYGYALFQYFAVDLATGELAELHTLAGQPATTILQPGAMPAYRHCLVNGTVVELLAVDERQGAGMLTFDLAANTVQFATQELTGSGTDEDNALPVGGGLASPDSPPYPQSLLPAEFGANWTIPALVVGGRLLLVTTDGAEWVGFGK